MNQVKGSRRRLVFFVIAILVCLSVGVVVFSKRKQEPKPRKQATPFKAELVNSVPPVSSKVNGLEIAGIRIVRQGTPLAALAVDVINHSDQPVISLEISSGDENDFSSLGLDGLEDPKKPEVIIRPNSLKTIEWGFGAILEGYPIRLSAATFGDLMDEGEPRYIEMMHKDRVRSKARLEAIKKGSPQ
jgi:hypothetical protein